MTFPARSLSMAAIAAVLQSAAAQDISGTVTGPKGPEAGVWVIAETTELPTRFARIVVTDDKGRYLIPDLPNVGYSVWVRGYGLVDSPRLKVNPAARSTSPPSRHPTTQQQRITTRRSIGTR